MIVSFFARGTGGGGGSVDYLLGEDRDREYAEVLSGDPDETVAIIDSSDYAKKYTSGVLSFEEADIAEEQKREIMASFEECLFPGLDKDQYNVLWVEHTDKGRLELNFVIPNLELTTGKRLQPYYHGADMKRVDAWSTVQNLEYGFTDPDDPAKRQAFVLSKDLPRGKKEAAELINDGIMALAAQGAVTNRDEVVAALEQGGFEVARQTKQSISIKDPDGGRNIRLRGAVYEQDFRLSKDVQRDIEQRSREHQQGSKERLEEARARYSQGIEIKQRELAKRYPREQQELAAGHTRQSAAHEPEFIQDLGGGYSVSDRSGYYADRLERKAGIDYPEPEPEHSEWTADIGRVAGGHGDGERGGQHVFSTEYGNEAARSFSEQRKSMDYQSEQLNDGDREAITELIERIGEQFGGYRERAKRDGKAHNEQLEQLGERARSGAAKYIKQLGEIGGTRERVGGVERAGGALERAKRGINRAVASTHQFIQAVKEKMQEKARDMGFSR